METIVSGKRIEKKALTSKIPPIKKYLIKPGDEVPVYKEMIRKREGPFTVKLTTSKPISVTDEKTVKQFNIRDVLPIAPNRNDAYLKHDLKIIHGNEASYIFPTLVTEVVKK